MFRLSEHNMASQDYTMRVSQNKTEQHNTNNKTTVFGIHTTKLSCKRNYFNKNTTGEKSLPNLEVLIKNSIVKWQHAPERG